MTKRDSIRIELTSEQEHQIRSFSGHEITAIELDAQELEQRIAPTSATGPVLSDLSIQKMVDK